MKKFSDIIDLLVNAESENILVSSENIIAAQMAVMILTLGSIANLIFTYLLNDGREWIDLQNCIVLIGIAIAFLAFNRMLKSEIVKSNIFGGLFVLTFIYVSINLDNFSNCSVDVNL